MKRIISLTISLVFVCATLLSLPQAASASGSFYPPACYDPSTSLTNSNFVRGQGWYPVGMVLTITASGPFYVGGNITNSGNVTSYSYKFTSNSYHFWGAYTVGNALVNFTVTCGNGSGGAAKPPQYNFMDGRCNQEPWQSFAVYPDGKGGWILYAVDKGVGSHPLQLTKAFMDANPDTGVNHIIAQEDGIQVWRLAGGLLQAHRIGMDDKDYWFNLDHCDGVNTASSLPSAPSVHGSY